MAEGATAIDSVSVVNVVASIHWIATNSPTIVPDAEVMVVVPASENIWR
jgi:hypothetical protein